MPNDAVLTPAPRRPTRSPCSRSRLLLLALLVATALPALAQEVRKVALAGEEAPGTNGRRYLSDGFLDRLTAAEINDAGQVAFGSWLTPDGGNAGTFIETDGVVSLVIEDGIPFAFAMNNHGDVVIHSGELDEDTPDATVMIPFGGTPADIALDGGPAPGDLGTYLFGISLDLKAFAINDERQVAFLAHFGPFPPSHGGLLLRTDGIDQLVMLFGPDAAPPPRAPSAGRFMNAAGQILLMDTQPPSTRLYAIQDGVFSTVAMAGDAAPADVGGTFGFIVEFAIATTGDSAAFWSTLDGGTAPAGIFVDHEGERIVAALSGDPALGTGGHLLKLFDPRFLSVNRHAEVAFVAEIGGPRRTGVFSSDRGRVRTLALEGDPAPGTNGGVFDGFGTVSLNVHGQVAFYASIRDGTLPGGDATRWGIFTVPAPSAPAQIVLAVTILALLRARVRPARTPS